MITIESNLIQRAKNGDALAFARLHDLYYPFIYRFFYYRVNDQNDVEDLSSELFLRMIEELGFYRPGGIPFKSWMYTLAKDLLLEYFSEQMVRTQNSSQMSSSPDSKLTGAISAEFLKHCLAHLNTDERELIIARLIEERSSHMVAREINKSIRNTRMRQQQALNKLNRIIHQEGGVNET